MNEKVSVIVPIYKAEQYLKQCVESLLAQTLDGVEIILLLKIWARRGGR